MAATRHTEREVKLAPPPEFDLGVLDLAAAAGAGSSAGVRALPSLALRATYLDTATLALVRAGITVRHRTGEGGERWTVKLPSGSGRRMLVRQELDFEGSVEDRPHAIDEVLAVHLRGRHLVPVAVLATARARVVVEGADGLQLVEVVHDRVTATRGQIVLGAWDEVEVEVVDAEEGAAMLRRVVRSLRDAGCVRAALVPKLVRALGEGAAAAPEVVVPALPRRPRPHDALERALARSVAQVLDHDPKVRIGGDPEDLHQFRVAIRRLRSDLRTFRRFFDPELVEHLTGELRWVADETNELRDLDVLQEWLETRGPLLPPEDADGTAALRRRCADQQAARRERLLAVLGSARYGVLVQDLVDLVTTPLEVSGQADVKARRRLARDVERRWHELRGRIELLEVAPSDATLHRARISTKRCRAAVEAIAPLGGPEVRRLGRSLAALQDVLGAAHDAAVFGTWLRQAAESGEAFVAGELAALAQAEAERQEDRWPEVWAQVRRRRRTV